MHVLATRPGGYAAGDGVVDLRQTPAEVVILSAADTDLLLLSGAAEAMGADCPSLRLASLLLLRSNASVDLYVDAVLRHARLVVVAMMGGTSYWPYGIDRLVELARDGVLELALVPGDDSVDPELDRLSSVSVEDCRSIWRYLREGGAGNAAALLTFLGQRFFARAPAPEPPRALPRVCVYDPGAGAVSLELVERGWRPGAPVAALLFYRAHLQAGNVRAFDALCETLARAGLNPLPIALASLKDPGCRAEVEQLLARAGASIVLNTTGFAIAGVDDDRSEAGALGRDRPVLQLIVSGGNREDWLSGVNGLAPRDLAMSVVLPEVDGRIITRAISFKGLARRSERAQLDVCEYQLDPDRARFVAELAARWVELARTPPAERRVALVLANYPARDGRIGNGVGLDTPASALTILEALREAGYPVSGVPRDPAELMAALLGGVSNELGMIDGRPALQSLDARDYLAFFEGLPVELQSAVLERWGTVQRDPRWREGRLVVSGLELGGTFIGIQPARGYEIDVSATYHDPDLVPPHGYLAFYAWLRRVYRAHALVHVGKHGNLEWLPGKSVALGPSCWPEAVFGPLPHLYPFIVNDPGEGTQAKRRAQAVIIDHLVPPLTRAESYGPLRDLEKLVDEYYQALMLDAPRAKILRRDILARARETHLYRELGFAGTGASAAEDERLLVKLDAYLCELKESQIRDGLHVFGRSPTGAQRIDTLLALARLPTRRGLGGDRSLIVALAQALLSGSAADEGAARASGMTAELGAGADGASAAVPGGKAATASRAGAAAPCEEALTARVGAAPAAAAAALAGAAPEAVAAAEAEAAAPTAETAAAGAAAANADAAGAGAVVVDVDPALDWRREGRSPRQAAAVTEGGVLEQAAVRAEAAAAGGGSRLGAPAGAAEAGALVFNPLEADFAAPWTGPRPALLQRMTSDPWRTAGDTRERLELLARAILAGEIGPPEACRDVVERVSSEIAPALDRSGACELAGLLRGLDGRFVPPGPSGAPTRGRLDVLPTGRNFYSVDVRAVPTPAAVELANRAAERLIRRYVQDHGDYPRSVALSVWGTATMRTGGDDVAQALALLGARPVWAEGSGRVVDTEILPASVLRRPRVDVTLRVSGFFRDAFPDLIRLFDSAVRSIAELDEPEPQNPIRARVRAAEASLLAGGIQPLDAARRARYRVFGSKPGAYGAGLQSHIDAGSWHTRADLAEAYLGASAYAYAADAPGVPARASLESQLAAVDAVLHNQDNREHDLLDSADYYEFEGGLASAVALLRGAPAPTYHGDHSNPMAPQIRSLAEEVARVVRSRAANPKWIAAARRHGYKGAAEMAATIEYLFGFAATAACVHDHQFALLSEAYVLDPENQRFLSQHNPSALREMTERLLDAIGRGLWREPGTHRDALEALLLDVEEGIS